MECTSFDVLVGCNRVVGALSWGHELVAFGASNVVVLYDPEVQSLDSSMNLNLTTWSDKWFRSSYG